MSVSNIRQRLESNLARVENLVSSASAVESGSASGPSKTDMLRAAVVFLHATLEDVIRSGLELELPRAGAEQLRDIPFVLVDDKAKTRKPDKLTSTAARQSTTR